MGGGDGQFEGRLVTQRKLIFYVEVLVVTQDVGACRQDVILVEMICGEEKMIILEDETG